MPIQAQARRPYERRRRSCSASKKGLEGRSRSSSRWHQGTSGSPVGGAGCDALLFGHGSRLLAGWHRAAYRAQRGAPLGSVAGPAGSAVGRREERHEDDTCPARPRRSSGSSTRMMETLKVVRHDREGSGFTPGGSDRDRRHSVMIGPSEG